MSFDKQITVTEAELRQIGVLDADQAHRNFDLLRTAVTPDRFADLLPLVLSSLSRSADPDMALNNLERFVGALENVPAFASLCLEKKDVLLSLMTIFGASRFLSTFLVTLVDEGPELLSSFDLTRSERKETLVSRLDVLAGSETDDAGFYRALRRFRKREMLRIGLRDLLEKGDLQEIVGELSCLAEVCLQKAYTWADAALEKRYGRPLIERPGDAVRAGFAVIAMGKLGGSELNFSSDVDLMYVYSADGETKGVRQTGHAKTHRITNHEYFVKLAEKMSAAINEKTDEGFVFRVDLRLRPEGASGPLAQSLGGYEIYYESWGQTWERSALIKARPVAGDDATGREFMERITPFVFRKYLDYGAITEIRDMKQKINKDVDQKGRTHRDVKLGHGGIREIEFVIQALQLIYAGRDRSLRERNSLKALHMLSQKGLITYREQALLSKAYVFLRTIEHRIQVLDDLQTQTLPAGERELRALARRSGYLEPGREAESLVRDYKEHTRNVRTIFDDLFAFTGETVIPESRANDCSLLLDPDTTEQEAVSVLMKLGFHEPGKAYRNAIMLREGPAFVHQTPRSRKFFSDMFPKLFKEIVASPDPDMALNHLESFLAAQGSWEAFQSLAKIDASSIRVLIAVFANSEYLSRMLVGRPEYVQNLMEVRRAAGSCANYRRELADALYHVPDVTEKLDVLRKFKHLEEIRIGMADLLSNVQPATVSRDLSKLAEVCLGAALDLAAVETGRRYGCASSLAGFAIIGVGKLGGRELTYGSDLDILFVYSEMRAAARPAGVTLFEYFSKVAEKTIAYLSTLTREGFVFRVDTRLRPTGSKGPLAQTIEAFRAYYASEAETWELQALLRARCVAGDRTFGAECTSLLQELIYQKTDRHKLAADVLGMRKRMEEEVGKENPDFYNIKQGAGGTVDIEFLVQYLQLLHGREHRQVRVPGTYNTLRALHKQKLLPDTAYHDLRQALFFMRRLESRMRIVSNQAASELSREPEKLRHLARRMGYRKSVTSEGLQLLEDYESMRKQVRSIFNRMMYDQ